MSAAAAVPGRIGPNAILRVLDALDERHGRSVRHRVLSTAGLAALDHVPPAAMVDEAEVVAMHLAARAVLGEAAQARIAEEAGARTAAYLLAQRIPRPAQAVLRHLPRRIAAAALLRAIAAHAWTFAGSASFAWTAGPGGRVDVRLSGGPFASTETAALLAPYYAAAFGRLFTHLLRTRCAVAADPRRGLGLTIVW